MRCDELEPEIEAIADGRPATQEELDHLRDCSACQARLTLARSIETLLASREIAAPPPAFTAAVMSRVGVERWHTERVVDMGFNVALALGLMVILASGFGLAWSIGLFSITVDIDMLEFALRSLFSERMGVQVQTAGLAAALLLMTLVLWWWAESDSTI